MNIVAIPLAEGLNEVAIPRDARLWCGADPRGTTRRPVMLYVLGDAEAPVGKRWFVVARDGFAIEADDVLDVTATIVVPTPYWTAHAAYALHVIEVEEATAAAWEANTTAHMARAS